jgi:hypothetical protein
MDSDPPDNVVRFSEGEPMPDMFGRRRRLRALITVAALAASGTAAIVTAPPGWAAATQPALTFANSATQSTVGSAYAKALTNLIDVNTVRYDPAVYNQSGLMSDPPGTFIRAGGGYPQPWTRDASVNSWNAASLLEPGPAENTLWSVVRRQSNGQLIINQDDQWWDQVVWLTAAWNHYLVTGDTGFLTDAYQAAANTLALRRSQNFNAEHGLFQGPAFFNDGIAGYPAPPADDTESKGSFVGSYAGTSTMLTLSTNALYYSAYRSAASMATALHRPAGEASAYIGAADALKTQINQTLWDGGRGTYAYFVHNGDSRSGTLDPSEEGTGLALAILFGIADPQQAQSVMRKTHLLPYGITDVYPDFPRYSASRPGRHNTIVWPMVQGFWADAAARSGNTARFYSELSALTVLANSSGQFAEIYHPATGAVDGGWQTGSHWSAAPDQTWSATAYLRMVYTDVFGMRFTDTGLSFAPSLPRTWGDVTLSNLHYRGATLTVALHGAGTVVGSVKVDGAAASSAAIAATATGSHTVDITLTTAGSGPVVGYSGWCLDDSQARTDNFNPVAIWECNGTGAQQWTYTGADSSIRVLGKCLDVQGGATANGTPVGIYDCNKSGAQVWQVRADSTLFNPRSNKCLEDPGSSVSWGTQVQIRDCTGAANQRWFLAA